jgi:general secretion pathway protein E/type IV pilus assembly protein PilB
MPADGKLFRSVGCRACRNVGYAGRMGIYELLITTNKIRQLAHDRASTWAITQAAHEEGMITLRQDGWRKVLSGRTTIDEVSQTTKGDIRVGH